MQRRDTENPSNEDLFGLDGEAGKKKKKKTRRKEKKDGLVHIGIQQRRGKTLTTIQGLSAECNLKNIVHAVKLEFACDGIGWGNVMYLEGDQRQKICDWLTKTRLVKSDKLKVHGF